MATIITVEEKKKAILGAINRGIAGRRIDEGKGYVSNLKTGKRKVSDKQINKMYKKVQEYLNEKSREQIEELKKRLEEDL